MNSTAMKTMGEVEVKEWSGRIVLVNNGKFSRSSSDEGGNGIGYGDMNSKTSRQCFRTACTMNHERDATVDVGLCSSGPKMPTSVCEKRTTILHGSTKDASTSIPTTPPPSPHPRHFDSTQVRDLNMTVKIICVTSFAPKDATAPTPIPSKMLHKDCKAHTCTVTHASSLKLCNTCTVVRSWEGVEPHDLTKLARAIDAPALALGSRVEFKINSTSCLQHPLSSAHCHTQTCSVLQRRAYSTASSPREERRSRS